MMALKSFDQFLNDLLTDYSNQQPGEDVGQDSDNYIRFACIASALWGMEKARERLISQIFPDTSDSENLQHHAWIYELTKSAGESDASLLSRVLEVERSPGRGGNKYDYLIWAKSVSIVANTVHQPLASHIGNVGLGDFNAANSIDDSTSTKAWDTDTATSGAVMTIDLGSGNHRNYVKVRLYLASAGYAGTYAIEYRDAGTGWVAAESGWAPSAAAWNDKSWDSVGSHRYWRLRLENDPGAGPDIMEMEWQVGAEYCASCTCVPTGNGIGTVDNYIFGNLAWGNPSDTLMDAVTTKIHDEQPADLPSGNVRILRPTFTSQSIVVSTSGDCDLEAATADIVEWINGLGSGEVLYKSRIAAICIDNGADGATVSTPASDVTPGSTEVIRTTSDDVTVS